MVRINSRVRSIDPELSKIIDQKKNEILYILDNKDEIFLGIKKQKPNIWRGFEYIRYIRKINKSGYYIDVSDLYFEVYFLALNYYWLQNELKMSKQGKK